MKSLSWIVVALVISIPLPVYADGTPSFEIVIKDHKFEPVTLEVPAGKKINLIIKNRDPTPEEFESYELNREKVVAGNSDASIFIGPLKPGTYPFFGEFNQATAQGSVIAK